MIREAWFRWMRALVLLVVVATAGPVTAQPRAGQPQGARVSGIVGDLAIRLGDGPWAEGKEGQVLGEGHEIGTGPDSECLLTFPDGSVLGVKEFTQLKIGTVLSRADRAKVEVFLKLGEVRAKVKHQETVLTDFSVRTPTATASVRGTEIDRISYYPSSGMDTKLAGGKLLVDTGRSQTLSSGTEQTAVDRSGELASPADLQQESCRAHVEPAGLTSTEREQVCVGNQPRGQAPGAGTGSSVVEGGGTTLIFRIEVQ